MLRHLPLSQHPSLLVGSETSDDAAVWRLKNGSCIASTTDFFAPIVDDARIWGRIAAVNAASDIYAMGGTPIFALNLVSWPKDILPLDLLSEVLLGGNDAAVEGDWIIAGGHTVDGPEPMYGLAVTGEIDADTMLTNAGGLPKQALVLTKPIGTGLLATAVKNSPVSATQPGGALAAMYEIGVNEMCRLNAAASSIALNVRASSATDVTGFGLLGHLAELATASGLSASINMSQIPLLPNVESLIDQGFVASGSVRNLEFLDSSVSGGTPSQRLLLADAQTSGGLLFACDQSAAEEALHALIETGHTAAIIGRLDDGAPGHITIDS